MTEKQPYNPETSEHTSEWAEQQQTLVRAIAKPLISKAIEAFAQEDREHQEYITEMTEYEFKIFTQKILEQIQFFADSLWSILDAERNAIRKANPYVELELDYELTPEAQALLAQKFKRIIEVELRNSYLEWISGFNTLTHLENARSARKIILKMIANKQKFTWAFFDAANLKAFNGIFGESGADIILRHIAKRLIDNLRIVRGKGQEDRVFHRSGDEFWLVENGLDYENAQAVNERIMTAFDDLLVMRGDRVLLEQLKSSKHTIVSKQNPESHDLRAIAIILEIEKNIGKMLEEIQQDEIVEIKFKIGGSLGFVTYDPQQDWKAIESMDNDGEEAALGRENVFKHLQTKVQQAEFQAKKSGEGSVVGIPALK